MLIDLRELLSGSQDEKSYKADIEMNTFKSAIPFSEFKTDDKGLVPCIVQDYRTGQVLMLAYRELCCS